MSSHNRAGEDKRILINEQMRDIDEVAAEKEQHRRREEEERRREEEMRERLSLEQRQRQQRNLERVYLEIAAKTPPEHHPWLRSFITDQELNDGSSCSEEGPPAFFGDLQRLCFLKSLARNEDDITTRLVYADWLDDQGEHEEAERQRKWPAAKAWFLQLCQENLHSEERLIAFGRNIAEVGRTSVRAEYDDEGTWGLFQGALEANSQEFWKNWSVMTGLPMPAGLENCISTIGFAAPTNRTIALVQAIPAIPGNEQANGKG
jgi:uncharacterized protein (TIGR02996 family)